MGGFLQGKYRNAKQTDRTINVAAKAVEEISMIIAQVSQISGNIASAIQEQAAATGESTSQRSSAAENLSKQAVLLKREFDAYIHAIRTA